MIYLSNIGLGYTFHTAGRWGRNTGKLAVIGQVLIMLGWLLQKSRLRALLWHVDRPLFICTFGSSLPTPAQLIPYFKLSLSVSMSNMLSVFLIRPWQIKGVPNTQISKVPIVYVCVSLFCQIRSKSDTHTNGLYE